MSAYLQSRAAATLRCMTTPASDDRSKFDLHAQPAPAPSRTPGRIYATGAETVLWVVAGIALILAIVSFLSFMGAVSRPYGGDAMTPAITTIACLLIVTGSLTPAAILTGMRQLENERHARDMKAANRAS